MRAIAWWNGLTRQGRTGWLLIAVCVVYILYFIKGRLLVGGDPIKTKEWVFFGLSFAGIMIGTINIRMAEMRLRNQEFLPLGDPGRMKKK